MHRSGGVIVKNEQGEILLVDRALPPLGWACPAGHIKDDESFGKGSKREVREEVGLKIKKMSLVGEEFLDWNECVMGVKGHDWKVFEAVKWSGEVEIDKKEIKQFKWVKKEDLDKMDLEEAWGYWFYKLGYITQKPKHKTANNE